MNQEQVSFASPKDQKKSKTEKYHHYLAPGKTLVIKDPTIENRFKIIEANGQTADSSFVRGLDLSSDYEAGNVIVIPDLNLGIDTDLFARIKIPGERKYAKEGGLRSAVRSFLQQGRVLSAIRLYFQAKSLEKKIRALQKTLFPKYKGVHSQFSWRFVDTGTQNMHIDNFQLKDDFHRLRFFVNLDNVPRIWNLSYSLTELYSRFGDKLNLTEQDPRSADELNKNLSELAFGNMQEVGSDHSPRHIVHFNPGSIWMCDSRKLSHQIFFGRRVLSAMFFIDPNSMTDAKANFPALVQTIKQAFIRPS